MITNGSKRYEIEIHRETDMEPRYAVNGTPVEGDAVEDLLSVVTGLRCYGLGRDMEPEEPVLEIEVRRNVPGFETLRMMFFRCNVDFCQVSFDQIDHYLVNKNYVSMIEALLKEL